MTNNACQTLHEWARELPRFGHGFKKEDLPKNGIYIVFEKKEKAHGGERIVRVGTHTGQNNLGKRIYEHLYKQNKDRSVFRKHIGRCLLHQDPFLEHWNLDCTKKVIKEEYKNIIDFDRQTAIEKDVSRYIADNLSFSVYEIENKDDRLKIEKGLLSLLTACDQCGPSPSWLGLKHQNKRIQQGLWNIQGLKGQPFNKNDLSAFCKKSPDKEKRCFNTT